MTSLLPEYVNMLEKLPPLLDELSNCPARPLSSNRTFPREPGVYVIFEHDSPLYTGRSKNIRQRIGNHISGRAEQSAFAFRLARRATDNLTATYRPEGSRKHLMSTPEFRMAFDQEIVRVRSMRATFVVIQDLLVQHLFEVYAATALKTPYNDFGTH